MAWRYTRGRCSDDRRRTARIAWSCCCGLVAREKAVAGSSTGVAIWLWCCDRAGSGGNDVLLCADFVRFIDDRTRFERNPSWLRGLRIIVETASYETTYASQIGKPTVRLRRCNHD